MATKKKEPPKPTGVNAGIKQGMAPEQFEGRVICKKCGKDIEYTLGSKLFQKCPRCGGVIERNPETEEKEAKKIVKWDILRRSKRNLLHIGFFLTVGTLAYNIVGFFMGLFDNGKWWLALLSLPFASAAYFCIRVTWKKSASRKYKFYAWLAIVLNCLAFAAVIVTAIPVASEKVSEWLGRS